MVVLLAGGASAIMNNTQTMATVLYTMERAISGASAGHAHPVQFRPRSLAMPLLAPLVDFANVSRTTTVTA